MLRGKLLTAAASGSARIADPYNDATSDYDDCVASDSYCRCTNSASKSNPRCAGGGRHHILRPGRVRQLKITDFSQCTKQMSCCGAMS